MVTKKATSEADLDSRNAVAGADEIDRLQHPVTGRDIVNALASSPLAEVPFDRVSVKSKVRDIRF
jgi:hypothetical protein